MSTLISAYSAPVSNTARIEFPLSDIKLVESTCTDLPCAVRLSKTIEELGGRVALVASPRMIFAWLDSKTALEVGSQTLVKAVRSTFPDQMPSDRSDRYAVRFLSFLQTEASFKTETSHDFGETRFEDREPGPFSPGKLDERRYAEALKKLGFGQTLPARNLSSHAAAKTQFAVTGNHDLMVGTIATALFFVESSGQVDADLHNWTNEEEETAFVRACLDFTWLSSMAGKYDKPLSFVLIPYYHDNPVAIQPYEPGNYSLAQDSIWISPIFNHLGLDGVDPYHAAEAYSAYLRAEIGTDWAFSALFPHNSEGGVGIWGVAGYATGPFVVIWSSEMKSGSPVLAHETGHVFNAPDEYRAGCGSTFSANTFNGFENGNCEGINPLSAPCLMRFAHGTICPFTAAHFGWTDRVNQITIDSEPSGILVNVKHDWNPYDAYGRTPFTIPAGVDQTWTLSAGLKQTLDNRVWQLDQWEDQAPPVRTITATREGRTLNLAYRDDGPATNQSRLYQGSVGGLSLTDISSQLIDQEGTLWIGSGNTIYRSKEGTVTAFSMKNSSNTDDYVDLLVDDRKGGVWAHIKRMSKEPPIIFDIDAVAHFDGTSWTIYEDDAVGQPNSDVISMDVDSRGNLWASMQSWDNTDRSGFLVRFDGSTWSKIPFPTVYGWTILTDIKLDNLDNVWVGSGVGLFTYRQNIWNQIYADTLIRSIELDKAGRIWVATDNQFIRFHEEKPVEEIPIPAVQRSNVIEIQFDTENTLYVLSPLHLFRYIPSTWEEVTPFSIETSPIMKSLYIDAEGLPWIGIWQNGLFYLQDNQWVRFSDREALLFSTYLDVTGTTDGKAWVGSHAHGLVEIEGKSIRYHGPNNNPTGFYVNRVFADQQDRIWFSGGMTQLCTYKDDEMTCYGASHFGLNQLHINDFSGDGRGGLFVATTGGLLHGLDVSSFTLFPGPADATTEYRSVDVDPDGSIWVIYRSTDGYDHVGRYKSGKWTTWSWSDMGLPYTMLNEIQSGTDDHVWVASQSGVVRFSNDTWTLFNVSNSTLPSNVVKRLARDIRGTIWLLTDEGLAQVSNGETAIKVASDIVLSYSNYEGIGSDANGGIWVCGNWKVAHFNEEGVPQENDNPRILSFPIHNAKAGSPYVYQVKSWDKNDATLHYHLVSAPSWLAINETTGLIEGDVPNLVQDSQVLVSYDVQDSFGGVAHQKYALFIHPYESPVDIVDGDSPVAYRLEQNYPNPFNPVTTIQYDVAHAGNVTLEVYDVLGRKVATLINGNHLAGHYAITFDARYLPSGFYVYRMEANGKTWNRNMLLVR